MAPKCRTFELLGADGLCPVRVTRAWRLLPPSPRAADISLAGGSGAANGCCCTCAATESLRRDRISRSCGSQTGSRLCWVLRHAAALRSGCKMETVLGSLHEGEERGCCRGAAARGREHPERPDPVLCSAVHLPEHTAPRGPAGSAPAWGFSPWSVSLSRPWDVSWYPLQHEIRPVILFLTSY